jgi:hypothetical protein
MPCKGGEIEIERNCGKLVASIRPIEGDTMGGIGKRPEHPNKDDDKSGKPPPAPVEDDDIEDGDIATPKRDRYGEDDQPL